MKSSDYVLLTFFTQHLLRLLLSLFLLNFGFCITIFCLFLLHIYPLHVFLLISLSYPDLSRCDTDDGTRTLDPYWWRVNKPSLGVPEALLDFRPIDGWLKGILIKRKSRGKPSMMTNQEIKSFLFFPLMASFHSLTLTVKCLHYRTLSLSPSHNHTL